MPMPVKDRLEYAEKQHERRFRRLPIRKNQTQTDDSSDYNGCVAGTSTREETIKKLNNNELYNQFTFCNERALAYVKFISSKEAVIDE